MVFLRSPALLLLCVVAAAGCSNSSDLCRNVTCATNRICNKATGACMADPNPKDAGVSDAGTKDGGSGVDGGAACVPGCAAGLVCDPATVTCVECFSNAQCTCPAGLCDLVSHMCIENDLDGGAFVQPVGESCANATRIIFPVCPSSSRTTFRVDLAARVDDEKGTCTQANTFGRDAVFLIDVPTTSDLTVTTAQAAGSNAQAVAYLRMTPCASGLELVCRDTFGAPISFRSKSLPPGQYALVIDSYTAASAGLVDVTVELLPPVTNETCSTPLEASTDGGTVTVDLPGALDDVTGSCNSEPDSRDAVWRVTLTERSDFHALVRATVPDAGDPVVYLRDSPCATGSELFCIDSIGDTETLNARVLDAGTYFLVVEGYGTSGSLPVTLTSWATPAPFPPNDSCSAPRVIDFTSTNSVRFTVDTLEGLDDDRGSCGTPTSGSTGPDAVYSFTLAATRTVTITSESADGGFGVDPVIYLRKGACGRDAGTEVDCEDRGGTPEVLFNALTAGQYFLFVDSYEYGSAGPTVVTVSLSP